MDDWKQWSFLLDKVKQTKNNVDFFDSMRRVRRNSSGSMRRG
jgi:transcription termination factor Rho